MKIAFITRKDVFFLNEIKVIVGKNFRNVDYFIDTPKSKLFQKLNNTKYDYLISYMCKYIFPIQILKKTKNKNINFHPGSPKYPGFGCYNFALYNKEKYYGSTVHEMVSKIDSGKIFEVRKFKILKNYDVIKLKYATHRNMLKQLKSILLKIKNNQLFYDNQLIWLRKPYTKKDFDKLRSINSNNFSQKFKNIIQSTYFKGKPGPFFFIGKEKYEIKKID